MAVALALSLIEQGGYDPDDVWQHWRAWAATAADVGITTREALGFTDWRKVRHHDPERTAANGALMRAFPLAIAFSGAKTDTVRDVVLRQAALTHPHPAAGWGAWLGVAMMRAGIHGDDPFETLEAEITRIPEDLRVRFTTMLAADWNPTTTTTPGNGSVWGCLAQAVWAVRNHDTFDAAVTAAIDLGGDTDTVACVTGAIAGSIHGIQAIPSRWLTYVNGSLDTPTGRREFDNTGVQELALALLGRDAHPEQPPEPPVGPQEIAPRLHAANLLGAASTPIDWAIVSLCRPYGRLDQHPVRREYYLIDQPGDHNGDLRRAVTDAVDTIDAFLAEGRNVVVHCHGGRSRTGLVLKAWKMRTDGVDERTAHRWLGDQWPLLADHNDTFRGFLQHVWPA